MNSFTRSIALLAVLLCANNAYAYKFTFRNHTGTTVSASIYLVLSSSGYYAKDIPAFGEATLIADGNYAGLCIDINKVRLQPAGGKMTESTILRLMQSTYDAVMSEARKNQGRTTQPFGDVKHRNPLECGDRTFDIVIGPDGNYRAIFQTSW